MIKENSSVFLSVSEQLTKEQIYKLIVDQTDG